MLEQIHIALTEIVQIYRDPRVHVCQLEATAPEENRCVLTGAVLNRETVTAVADGLAARFPQITFDITNVRVLRTAPPQLLTVATNVTGLHAQASFQSEMVSQLLNGWTVELLREESRWAFVSLPNHAGQGRGYLGWAYRPYLVDAPALVPTHIVCEPVSLLRAAPAAGAPLISRIAGGTSVAVDQETSKQVDEEVEQPDLTLSPCHPSASSGQALVTLRQAQGRLLSPFHGPRTSFAGRVTLAGGQSGWVPAADLRGLTTLPTDEADRRAQIVADAARFIGVPYLWGGCTAFGIDCSGFAQMLYRLIGVAIPRDADMQCAAGRPIESAPTGPQMSEAAAPPFEPGDLLFFGEPGESRTITHIGVSLGGWRIVHSSRSRNGVYEDDVQAVEHLRAGFIAARTFLAMRD
jgi:cell wall-associated NlpC family hydrolase